MPIMLTICFCRFRKQFLEMPDASWIQAIETDANQFAERYGAVYLTRTERELSASFEIGCFLAVVKFYERKCSISLENLTNENEYRYLTTPSGNPANFSFVRIERNGTVFQLRQQVRIASHIGTDVAFTPDFVVMRDSVEIKKCLDPDYAGGKRAFFSVHSRHVIAAHECKSMNPFPELLVSFIGTLIAGHAWMREEQAMALVEKRGMHLAPTLFVTEARLDVFYIRMVKGLEACYPSEISFLVCTVEVGD